MPECHKPQAWRHPARGERPPRTQNSLNISIAFCFNICFTTNDDHKRIIKKRDRFLARLPNARDILRGSLLQRTIRHRTGCPKCARGEGHPVTVLAVGYPGGVIRQISLPPEQSPHVSRCLANYRKLKAALEQICELNQQLLRSQRAEAKTRRPK